MIQINCDLCGKVDEQLNRTLIEGVELSVCGACSKFGKILAPVKRYSPKEQHKMIQRAQPQASKEEKIQILQITQKGVQKSLRALAKDEDWGSPLGYDIVVTREGKELDTKYQVNPKPAKELDKKVQDLFLKTKIDLTALYRSEDPFAVGEKE